MTSCKNYFLSVLITLNQANDIGGKIKKDEKERYYLNFSLCQSHTRKTYPKFFRVLMWVEKGFSFLRKFEKWVSRLFTST